MAGFWHGKKALVTGADGFIGSHLAERLVHEGAAVSVFTCYNSFGSNGWLDESGVRSSMAFVPGDIRDAARVAEAVRGQEYVFHLAALSAIPYSYLAGESYIQTNVIGTLHVLNACLKQDVRRLVHTSTSEVYGSARTFPMDESHPLHAQSPYAASKVAADQLAQSYHNSFDLPVTLLRPFNTYGPRQSTRAVVPAILSQLWAGCEALELGSLEPVRDLTFVDDTVAAFLRATEAPGAVGIVLNVGSGRAASIAEVVEMAFQITGRRVPVRRRAERLRPPRSEVDRLICDAGRLRAVTGWRPEYTLEQGLRITSDWVRLNLARLATNGMAL